MKIWFSRMAHWLKVFEDLGSVPGTHTVKEQSHLLQTVLTDLSSVPETHVVKEQSHLL